MRMLVTVLQAVLLPLLLWKVFMLSLVGMLLPLQLPIPDASVVFLVVVMLVVVVMLSMEGLVVAPAACLVMSHLSRCACGSSCKQREVEGEMLLSYIIWCLRINLRLERA